MRYFFYVLILFVLTSFNTKSTKVNLNVNLPTIIKTERPKKIKPKVINLKELIPSISQIESSNGIRIRGDKDENGIYRAYGHLQIWKICVDDVNRIYKTKYTHAQMDNLSKASEVFELYLKFGIKLYKKKYNKEPSLEEIVRMWNGGIYTGYKKQSTKKYWIKFKEVYNEKINQEIS